MKCENQKCARPIDNDSKFCPWCGKVYDSTTGKKEIKQYLWIYKYPTMFYAAIILLIIAAIILPPPIIRFIEGGHYTLGKQGQGGIVFFDRGDYTIGWRYLEVATNDADEGFLFWTELSKTLGEDMMTLKNDINHPTRTAIGAGREATWLWFTTLRNNNINHFNFAAFVCYTWGNRPDAKKNDWYQPNIEELKELYQAYKQGIVDGFQEKKYLSTSINEDGKILALDFKNGDVATLEENDNPSLRAIRRIEVKSF